MDTAFQPIRIVSLEDEMTVEAPDRPPLSHIFLKLSQTPPPLWQNVFRDARKITRHAHWRKAWLDRKYIVVECMPEELEKYHLPDLRQDIARANQAYADYLQKQSGGDHSRETVRLQEREKLREIKDRLNFD